MKPLAREEKLTVRELPEETLVYDLERHKAHCLNRAASLVWKHCDGRCGPAALAAVLRQELHLLAGEADAAARLALEQLSRRNLLEEPVKPAAGKERLTRREALRKMAVAAAAALPVVMTLRSPSVAWAQGGGKTCITDLDCATLNPCQTGLCSGANPGPHTSFKQKGHCNTSNKPDGTPCFSLGGLARGVCKNGQCVSGSPTSGGGEGSPCTGSGQGTCNAGCLCLGGACSC